MKFKDVVWMSLSTDSRSSASELLNEPLGGNFLVSGDRHRGPITKVGDSVLDLSIFYIQCVLITSRSSSAPARREAEVPTDPACLLDRIGTGHVSQQTLGCCPAPSGPE